jgi:hypothetical protein
MKDMHEEGSAGEQREGAEPSIIIRAALTKALAMVDPTRLLWLLQDAAQEQRAYILARRKVEVIEDWRDQVLAEIDTGERTSLTETERTALRTIDAAYLAAEEAQLANEEPLLAFVRSRLWADSSIIDRRPEYAVLLDVALGGRRSAALDLAAWLGYEADAGDEDAADRLSDIGAAG